MSTFAAHVSAVVAVAAALSGCLVLAFARGRDRSDRRSWHLIGLALLVWAAGAAVSWAPEVLTTIPLDGRLPHVGYLGALLALVAAVVLHPCLSPREVRTRALANAVIIAASATTIFWYLFGLRMLEQTGDPFATTTAMLYPSVGVMLVALSIVVMFRVGRSPAERVHRRSSVLVSAAFTVFSMGNLHDLIRQSHKLHFDWNLYTETLWLAGFGLIVAATFCSSRHRTPAPSERRRDPRPQDRMLGATLGLAPVLAAIAAGVTALGDWIIHDRVDPTGILMLTTVIPMVLARQSLTLNDNRHLSESLELAVADLLHQASHDRLTGLPNRSQLTDRLHTAILGCDGTSHVAALLFVDLDHLKPVNDSLGHGAGDRLLRTTAERITLEVGARVTRFGGDEFVITLDDLPVLDPVESAEVIARRIVDATAAPITIDGNIIRPSVSIGLAVADPGVTPEELLRRADLALYEAKAMGRRRVATYDPAGGRDVRHRINLEAELRAALRNDEFEVHYQPVVELATGRIEGVETLLRWRHPERGLLTPDEFLQEAATSGLLGPIGERTLLRACADLTAIRHRTDGPPLSVAFNLSTTELTDGRVVHRVRKALDTFGLDPSRLVIEITEDVVVDETIRTTIDDLRALGVHLAIDDFGTGNSSLRQLGTYPAGVLKIDRSFIAHLGEDRQASAIVRAILGLARNLGLRTVAEGVETAGQALILAEFGCDLAQGWLFAKAMPLDELEQHLASLPPRHSAVRPTVGPLTAERSESPSTAQPPSRSSASEASAMIRSSSSATGGRSEIAPTT